MSGRLPFGQRLDGVYNVPNYEVPDQASIGILCDFYQYIRLALSLSFRRAG
jgi:hypothetical protein